MSDQEKNDKESIICLTPKPSQSFFVNLIQSKERIFSEKELFKKKSGDWALNKKNEKKAF